MNNIAVSCSNIKKSYPLPDGTKLEILKDISISVSKGESVAVMGASGSGKTTMLHIIAGIDKPDSGQINGNCGTPGLIFQAHHLLPEFSAYENVLIPARLFLTKEESEIKAEKLLKEVGLSDRMNHMPNELSGGEIARVAIARALAINSELILADEPTGNLDEKTSEKIQNLLFNLISQKHSAMVLVTHDSRIAKRASRILHLEYGVLK